MKKFIYIRFDIWLRTFLSETNGRFFSSSLLPGARLMIGLRRLPWGAALLPHLFHDFRNLGRSEPFSAVCCKNRRWWFNFSLLLLFLPIYVLMGIMGSGAKIWIVMAGLCLMITLLRRKPVCSSRGFGQPQVPQGTDISPNREQEFGSRFPPQPRHRVIVNEV